MCRRNAFTLLEMMIVVLILAILIALLIPVVSRVRESANRITCASNIRSLTQAALTYASANNGSLPSLYYSTYPHWFNEKTLDAWRDSMGLRREFFFCPSNPLLNTQAWWDWPTAPARVIGYIYLGGNDEISYRNSPSFSKYVFSPTPTQFPVFPMTTRDVTTFDVLWADLNRTNTGNFGNAANHLIDPQRTSPVGGLRPGNGGANVSFIDGHVEWRRQGELRVRASTPTAAPPIAFYW